MSSFTNSSPYWDYVWQDLCGPDGMQIWSPIHHDLGLCFQRLFLDIPILMLLAVFSAYFFGRHELYVSRGKTQLYAINTRCLLVILLAVLPILKFYIALNKTEVRIAKIFYFLSAVEAITWFTHFGYVFALRNRLGLSSRGPVSMCVLWSIVAVLSFICLRTHILIYNHSTNPDYSVFFSYAFSIVHVILQISYALTLVPNVGDTIVTHFENMYTRVRGIPRIVSK